MFTKIKVKNFKSLKNLEINFKKNSAITNNFIAIYGENGSGKTNITEVFEFLKLSINHNLIYSQLFKNGNLNINNLINEISIKPHINPLLFDFKYSTYRTIDEKEPTEIEYNFEIDGKVGYYYIRFYDQVVEERLFYRITRQNNYFFEITQQNDGINIKLNDKVFVNENYKNELEEEINKYWGKFSFLSLLKNEMSEKNITYLTKAINENFFEFYYMITNTSVVIDKYKLPQTLLDIASSQMDLVSLKYGTIRDNKKKERLLKYESALQSFFTELYADIENVKYDFIEKEDCIEYKLNFYKKLENEIYKIPIEEESRGTIRLVDYFETLVKCLDGEIVIIDEIDNGIHDLLIKNIIEALIDKITGQLIITTHNTLLLEFVPKEKIYILTKDSFNNKKLYSINDFDINVQKNNNLRNLYLKGVFGGVPTIKTINFEKINNTLHIKNNKK